MVSTIDPEDLSWQERARHQTGLWLKKPLSQKLIDVVCVISLAMIIAAITLLISLSMLSDPSGSAGM